MSDAANETTNDSGTTERKEPIIIDAKPKKKKRYSKGHKKFGKLDDRVVKVDRKIMKALEKASSTWADAHHKSGRKKKNGGQKDALRNLSKGLRKGIGPIAEAPFELLDGVTKMKGLKKLLRG